MALKRAAVRASLEPAVSLMPPEADLLRRQEPSLGRDDARDDLPVDEVSARGIAASLIVSKPPNDASLVRVRERPLSHHQILAP